METSQELQHWGISGMKWGIRRYQNKDGSYTPEGIKRYNKKYPYQDANTGSLNEKGMRDYMKAARKGQLDYKRLSDKELDMINNRFNKENTYKQNVEKYEKSTFKYKAKEALLNRIAGNGGGGKGKGKGGGGKGKGKGKGGKGNGEQGVLSSLFSKSIKEALDDAFKTDNENGEDENDSQYERGKGFFKGGKDQQISDFVTDRRISIGKSYAGHDYTRSESLYDDFPKWNSSSNSTTSEKYLYDKHGYKTPQAKNAERYTSNKRKKRAKHDGMDDGIVFVITRSDEYLMHYGISGQKWGKRRWQNEDGSLTAEE